MDMFNIMTDNFYGSWDNIAGHNSPLNAKSLFSSVYNMDGAFKLFNTTHNVPANKINLGTAFYGRSFANCTRIGGSHSDPDLVNFPNYDGAPAFWEVKASMAKYNRNWDAHAQVTFITGKNMNSFVSYDDEESVCLKDNYVKSKSARDIIIWEISGDSLDKNTAPYKIKLFRLFILILLVP